MIKFSQEELAIIFHLVISRQNEMEYPKPQYIGRSFIHSEIMDTKPGEIKEVIPSEAEHFMTRALSQILEKYKNET